jgi:CRISPR-associated endonuclease/helicase Cas3
MPFNDFKFDKYFFDSLIKNSSQYYAHTRNTDEKELLSEHSSLVMEYCFTFIHKNGFEPIINGLIDEYLSSIQQKQNPLLFGYIKELFVLSIAYHDFGKVNPQFQKLKMNNYHVDLPSINHEIDSQHSILSAYIFIMHQTARALELNFPENLVSIIDSLNLVFAYPMLKHHNSNLDNLIIELNERFPIYLSEFLKVFNRNVSGDLVREVHDFIMSNSKTTFEQFENNYIGSLYNEFPLFALVKLNYSLLTASDYLATTHYMSQWNEIPSDFGLLNSIQKQRIVESIKTSKQYNKTVYENLDGFKFTWPQEQSNENLNQLRTEMAVEVIQNIRENTDKHLFYIEAPTGGGKTNLSMIALAELLSADVNSGKEHINKVFYVFPFTTLITQTYKALIETFELDENEITQIHSKAGLQYKNKSDDNYGNQRLNYIDYLFVNYPIVLLSHIKFFDILKTNRKEENYLVHRLANSAVIIDELQSYSPSQWDKMMYLIDNYARFFNIKFILMSATLPKIGKLLGASKESEFTYLINDKTKYFLNDNFKGRVLFDFSLYSPKILSKEEKPEFLRNLAQIVFLKSKEYYNQNDNAFTIIEFIFKKTATEFYHIAEKLNDNHFFNEIFVLSGTILETRRKEIIGYLKNKNNQGKNVLLITTQVVEAGVDIDMDLGFKDTSIVDSDEQLAGRINRNVTKKQCVLYLFNCDSANILYKKDLRFELLNNELSDKYHSILENKSFDILYDAVIDKKNNRNASDYFEGLNDYKEAIRKLNFSLVDDSFKLIDQENYSIFIPLEIPVKNLENEMENNFSRSELLFLDRNNKYMLGDDIVSGKRVWELYEQLITDHKHDDFLLQKANLKNIQGIMSKYIISIFAHSKDVEELRTSANGEEKYGFLYLSYWDILYDYKSGLNITNSNAIFL